MVTEHFKESLPYQSFLVGTDNNPVTYIMTTPNLDATGHQWVGALVWFNFELEYQKGHDNTVADVVSDFLMNKINFCWRRQAFTSFQTWLPQV